MAFQFTFKQLAFTSVALVSLCNIGYATAKDDDQQNITKDTKPVERLVVRGRKPSTVAASATKSDTPIIDTAQSVSVVTRNEMDIRGVLNLNQAIRYIAGVTPDQRGGSITRYDFFALRGFTVPTFLDGLKLQASPTGFASPQTDTSRLERVEVLKGPSSALYGQSSPGGLVALSSKLPTDQRNYGSITATGGSFDLWRVDADQGGYANTDGTVRYRIYGTANGQHSQLSKTGSERFSISPSVMIGGDGPTTLTLLGNYQYDPKNSSYGSQPYVGTLKRASYGYLPRDFYDGDLGYEEFKRYQGALTYIFTQRINNDWSFTSRGRYDNVRTLYESVYGNNIYSAPTTLTRGAGFARERMQNLAFDNQLRGHVKTGPVNHNIMTGFDYQQSNATETAGFGDAPDLDVLNPNYRQVIPTITDVYDYLSKPRQYGVYGQDEMTIGRHLFLNGSIRHDWYHSTAYAAGTRTDQNAQQITWRASALYHFDFGLSPYVSYSTSFEPQSGLVQSGDTYRQADPSKGKQIEGGTKYQIPGTPVLLTAAGFHIEQTNVLVPVGNLGYNTQSGKVHSDGFELEAHADMYKGLMLDASFSSQRVHDDSTDRPLIQSSRGNVSAFAFYSVQKGLLYGAGLGFGIRHMMGTYGGVSSEYGDIYVPSYTVFDASARYDLGRANPSLKGWNISASVRNLFDKHFVASCYSDWCWYGERRNAQASVGYSW
ncbi:TonB-dependent receptor [Neokomagataea thailandica NBRC 106555]|uniref:TonB-dependent siderophore receptor n=2 Tax=Neokomagataea TaxID=1223423 RepID=A0A4Y6V3W2_9PROT|nr:MULTISPECIES: TonB-dependent siderophore receptor [Neokomagataea]QDH24054.1 TonB-dependent siderophore receptor [Neokomagataea tanensis]GBR50259.1 TonB-dependent receptor [Neokomagataea thailandica NBRC 106555]